MEVKRETKKSKLEHGSVQKSVSEIVSELKAKHAMEIAALKKENAALTALTKQMNGIVSERVADEGDE